MKKDKVTLFVNLTSLNNNNIYQYDSKVVFNHGSKYNSKDDYENKSLNRNQSDVNFIK